MSHTQGAAAPIVAQFTPSFSIRIVTRDGEPWFVAKDVAEALDYTWTGTQRIKHVPEEWRGVTSVVTPSGDQETAVLSEPGLYFFLARSDKPKALPFQKWLAGEVLPSIRKTGTYTAKTAVSPAPTFLTHQDMENLTRLVWIACHDMPLQNSWTQAVWVCLRRAANCPAPERFTINHVPALTAEIRRILELAEVVRETHRMAGNAIMRRVLKGHEAADAVIADMQQQSTALLSESRDDLAGLLDNWCNHDIVSFAERREVAHMNYQSGEARLLN